MLPFFLWFALVQAGIQPSLEGVWSYATLTPVEFFSDAQAAAFEAQTIGRNDRDRRDGGADVDAARGVADYWFDRGEHVASVNGRKRTSWVIDRILADSSSLSSRG